MKRVVVILIFVVVLSATFSVVSAQPNKRFCLEIEELCNVDDLLPAAVEVKGSSQGMAIAGRYAFLMHDKGGCVVLDIKRLKYFLKIMFLKYLLLSSQLFILLILK